MFGGKKAAFGALADSYLALCPVTTDLEAPAGRSFHPDKPETMTLGAESGMREIADPQRLKYYEQLLKQ